MQAVINMLTTINLFGMKEFFKKHLKTILWTSGSIAALGGVYAYVQWQKKRILDSDVKVVGISMVSFKENVLTLAINMEITNHTNIQLNVKEMHIDVWLAGQKIGFAVLPEPRFIPKLQTVPVSITASFDVKSIGSNAISMLLGVLANHSLSIRLDGYAVVQKGLIQFTIPIEDSETVNF